MKVLSQIFAEKSMKIEQVATQHLVDGFNFIGVHPHKPVGFMCMNSLLPYHDHTITITMKYFMHRYQTWLTSPCLKFMH